MSRLVVILLIMFVPAVCLSHSGRTDANGGHYNRKTGVYHFHSGGSAKVKTYTTAKRKSNSHKSYRRKR